MQIYICELNNLVKWKQICICLEHVMIPPRRLYILVIDASDERLITKINDMEKYVANGIVSTHIPIASNWERAARELVKLEELTNFAKVFWDETLKEIRVHAKTSQDLETMKSCITTKLGLNQQPSVRDIQTQTKYYQPEQHPFHLAFRFHERLGVHIYSCDILEAKTVVIVNAANEFLGNGPEKAGKALTDECNIIVSKQRFGVTDAVGTTAGRLPHKAVLHAIGPRWTDYQKKREYFEDLRKTIKNILHTAEKRNLRSVAIPSISAGKVIISIQLRLKVYS